MSDIGADNVSGVGAKYDLIFSNEKSFEYKTTEKNSNIMSKQREWNRIL